MPAGGAALVIKHYDDVKPDSYQGMPEGVRLREMITAHDGAPNFSLRVFDLEAGASTPFHAHPWEHEVFILTGTGTVRTEGRKTPFRAGACVYVAPQEAHCFVADPGTPVQFICVIPVKDQCGL